MRSIVLASTFVLEVAAGASAQLPAAPAAPAVPTVPVVPPAPFPDVHVLPTPFPAVSWTPHELHIPELPDFSHVENIAKLAAAQAGKAVTVVTPGKGEPIRFYTETNSGDAAYSQARNFIDRNQYDRALEPLDRVINAKSDRSDAAMYWKAYSLMKLARRDEALSTLGQMQKQYADSRWSRDARALEVEIKQAAGQPVGADAADDDVKLLALQGIMRTDPDAAFPVVEKMLAGGSSVRVKERALFVLSQSRNDRALGIIGSVARAGSNPDLQRTAVRYLGQSNSPDALATLTAVYKADNSIDVRKAVVSALSTSRNTGAVTALVTLARAERNPELRTSMVRYLSNSNNPEAKQYMLELLK